MGSQMLLTSAPDILQNQAEQLGNVSDMLTDRDPHSYTTRLIVTDVNRNLQRLITVGGTKCAQSSKCVK